MFLISVGHKHEFHLFIFFYTLILRFMLQVDFKLMDLRL